MISFVKEDNTIQYLYSKIGKHHIDAGTGNQDSVYIGKICDETYCLVVSDGVSSCKWAKTGSEATIDTIRTLSTKIYHNEISIDDGDGIKRFIVRDWKNHFDESWNDYGTTINFVIWSRGIVLAGQIGDGLLIGVTDGENFLMTDMDENYSVETYALAEVVLKSSIQLTVRKNVNNLIAIAMTDGIGKEMNMESIYEFQDYFVDLIKNRDEETRNKEVELWMSQLNQKNDDDKTIALMVLEGKT
ncbi:protein phosphatase 2C domain-containing protein [Anaerotignum propionicum]|uniref:protein phosphatase 2C domain-containing protein n=1 Tax=Anaerotignum propionicum TaxID=28446 RepID=UPI00289F7272|nr:protein phosphatase 2C domain-containing protein [Anaerotignum propionicum]